jgi:hypothetical protein
MANASVKGAIFGSAAEEVRRLRDTGAVSPERLEVALDARALALLDEKLNPASWYPMASYGRLLALLGEIEGHGRDDYFRDRGRANAQRLMDAGLYQQLAFIERWSEQIRPSAVSEEKVVASFVKNLTLVISMARSIYNVGDWQVEADPDYRGRVRVVVSSAEDYTEPMRLAAEGFLSHAARRKPDLYVSERPSRARIVFRTTRPVAELTRG